MATQAQLSIIGDIILKAFDNDAAKFEAYLTRAALETEKLAIESHSRKERALADADAAKHQAVLVADAEELARLQAEIDSL